MKSQKIILFERCIASMLFVRRFSFTWILSCFVLLIAVEVRSETIFLEAEGFQQTGDWLFDQQSIEAMGSPYLLAHGLGRPVADAVTTVSIPSSGRYRVLARTKDWVARWKAPAAPGRFNILIDGKPTGHTLGIKDVDWGWQDAGSVELRRGQIEIALHDLTGFEGRCDAVILTSDPDFVPPQGEKLKIWRRKMLGNDGPPSDRGEYDVVVVGGGVAGCCTAISAARLGLDVALIQNRPVLGASNMWYTHDTGRPAPFPICPWAVQVGDNPAPTKLTQLGHWDWEGGFDMDTILDAETIRDNNLRGMYGVWSHLKNAKKLYPNREIKWAAYISGRRESRRLMGDMVLTEDDILTQKAFPDACVTSTWSIDLHYPIEAYIPLSPQSPFISYANFGEKRPYPVPYRCFYSRNIDIRVVTRQSTDTLAVDDPAVAAALVFIRQNIAENPSVAKIVAEVGIVRRELERKFRALLGCSIGEELRRVKVEKAKGRHFH